MANEMHFSAVAVVQSLRALDRKTGSEIVQEVIRPECRAAGLASWFYDVQSGRELLQTIDRITSTCIAENQSPILHLETHGDDDGLQMSNDDIVTWEDLRIPLEKINTHSGLNLLVSLAACSGVQLQKVLKPIHRAPVWGIVGPKQSMKPDELFADFSAFFRELLRTQDGIAALRSMNGGPPSPEWRYSFMSAEYMFKIVYRRYLADTSGKAAIDARATELATRVVEMDPLLHSKFNEIAANAKEELQNHAQFFERYFARYFMTDLYPENAARFPVRLEEVS